MTNPMTDREREAFEAKFPVPALIEWNDSRGKYWPKNDDTKWWGQTVANAHNMRLDAWKAGVALATEAHGNPCTPKDAAELARLHAGVDFDNPEDEVEFHPISATDIANIINAYTKPPADTVTEPVTCPKHDLGGGPCYCPHV
jgi:hypothetical protein